jgi:hypothetical protein
MNYKDEFRRIINHEEGKYFLLDFGGDQASISIFAYVHVLQKLGILAKPKINSFVQLSSLPDKAFLKKYNVGFRWLYPKPSKRMGELIRQYKETFNIDVAAEIKEGYVSGGKGNFFIDEWGVKWKRSAFYFEQVEHPLQGKSFEEIKKYSFPDPTDPLRVENLKNELQSYLAEDPNYVIPLSQSYGGILETALWIRGYTDFYVDLWNDSRECRTGRFFHPKCGENI